MHLLDIHTHLFNENTKSAILNCSPSQFSPKNEHFYSVGIHPWDVTSINSSIFDKLKEISQHPHVLAIGETGLDKLKKANWDLQIESFKQHISISELLHKPLIIHCVKSVAEIIALKKTFQPKSTWIIHGFRGNKELGIQLSNHNIYISFGEKYNNEALINTPVEQLFIETDESKKSIYSIYKEIAQKRSTTIEILTNQVKENISAIFF